MHDRYWNVYHSYVSCYQWHSKDAQGGWPPVCWLVRVLWLDKNNFLDLVDVVILTIKCHIGDDSSALDQLWHKLTVRIIALSRYCPCLIPTSNICSKCVVSTFFWHWKYTANSKCSYWQWNSSMRNELKRVQNQHTERNRKQHWYAPVFWKL